jgi:hypothetical protein
LAAVPVSELHEADGDVAGILQTAAWQQGSSA